MLALKRFFLVPTSPASVQASISSFKGWMSRLVIFVQGGLVMVVVPVVGSVGSFGDEWSNLDF